jgi:hypothetical protein
MRPDKPLELLQGPCLADQEILSDRIEFLCRVDGFADVFDNAVVDEVQRSQMGLDLERAG